MKKIELKAMVIAAILISPSLITSQDNQTPILNIEEVEIDQTIFDPDDILSRFVLFTD